MNILLETQQEEFYIDREKFRTIREIPFVCMVARLKQLRLGSEVEVRRCEGHRESESRHTNVDMWPMKATAVERQVVVKNVRVKGVIGVMWEARYPWTTLVRVVESNCLRNVRRPMSKKMLKRLYNCISAKCWEIKISKMARLPRSSDNSRTALHPPQQNMLSPQYRFCAAACYIMNFTKRHHSAPVSYS